MTAVNERAGWRKKNMTNRMTFENILLRRKLVNSQFEIGASAFGQTIRGQMPEFY